MNRLPLEKRVQILQMLVEGSSMRAISRVVDVSINTVTKLLEDAGRACAAFHDERVQRLTCRRIQCDEIWSFCYAKAKNVEGARSAPIGAGDVWTWTSIDADSRLIANWLVGQRDVEWAEAFIQDLRNRLQTRVQVTTDGLKIYVSAIENAFGSEVDYAQLVKVYGEAPKTEERKYSPAECIGTRKWRVQGDPDPDHVSTSYVERQNFQMRMSMKRFARLSNAFSRKLANHRHALALYFVFYNWIRIHKSLRITPAMAAGLTHTPMEWGELVAIIDVFHERRKARAAN